MTEKKKLKVVKTKKKPPETVAPCVQMDLFSQFLTNDVGEVSNTIEMWESIPKYFFTPHQQKKLRPAAGQPDPFEWEFTFNNQPCTVEIHPALIKQENGSYKAFFPSVTEELVEEALKKILTDQRYGLHDVEHNDTWVRFTLRMIQKELKAKRKTRDIAQIKQAIEVMSLCNIVLSVHGEEVWRGSILQDLVTVGRDDYVSDTSSHHIARLPQFVTQGINRIAFRQFNYQRYMLCDDALTRWIYKRLINRFRHASMTNDYHFMYSDLKETGHLQQAREANNREKVTASLDELVKRGVLCRYTSHIRKEGRRIVDVKYTVYPSRSFVTEQKAANKRSTEAQQKALDKGIMITVDNLH